MLTDDSGSDKPGPGAADGAESELGSDGLSEKFGENEFLCVHSVPACTRMHFTQAFDAHTHSANQKLRKVLVLIGSACTHTHTHTHM